MSGLSTDLYQIAMMAGYHAQGMTAPCTFELFVRELPPNRSYLIAAGLEQALEFLEGVAFSREEIAYLRGVPALRDVPSDFFDSYLPNFRFRGEVWAIEEGTPAFALEPLVRVTAPPAEAQLVETALLAIITFQTSIASKAARIVQAAGDRSVIEFGTRRAHGLDAGLHAARAAFIAGCEATSNVEAGARFGIPVAGTMAHSWITLHPSEREAFERYATLFGGRTVLLIDTYDTLRAARTIVEAGLQPAAVRLDSGDLVSLSREVRAILDAGGLRQTRILASSDLDEHRIARLLAAGAPIDGFGVGTALSTSNDAPALGGVYKVVEVERGGVRQPLMKRSADKVSYPGRKQVWRVVIGGEAEYDLVGSSDETPPAGGEPLLTRVMVDGRRERPGPPLRDLQTRCRARVATLPSGVRRLSDPARYPVRISETLQRLMRIGLGDTARG